jgi:FMN phosphatase YigB (HAD superfamily)
MMKILTDCDGVLLDWEGPFHEWMQKKGYSKIKDGVYSLSEAYGIPKEDKHDVVREFNESAWICCLPVLRDSRAGIATLADAGYTFDCITSISADPYTKNLRWQNLKDHFGNVFDELHCIGNGHSKDATLSQYQGTGYWWIEDLPKNCEAGLKQGLKPILIDHPHNRDYKNPDVIRVKNWKEICEVILDE